MFHLAQFIKDHVTRRQTSMFAADIEANRERLIDEIAGKSVLVIGGAGTIGSSFIRAILPFRPAALTVVDINENALTELTRDLRSTPGGYVPEQYVTYPMNFNDAVFDKMFRAHRGFDIVANFSAHKHVRSEKDVYSVEALLENNVLRARKLLRLLEEYPPRHYFCVSTDKAANPVNIMGGSKKIMEDMIMAYSDKFPVTTARFANVAFSNGSLPDGWIQRIARRQPLSAPNDVTRYFVSPDESGEICMLACMLGNSGEIYFPKLSKEQVKTFSSIATELLQTLGYRVVECQSEQEAIDMAARLTDADSDYPVYYSGSNTTGEKPYEEFFTETETTDMTRHGALGVVTGLQPRPMAEIDQLFEELTAAFEKPDTTKAEIVVIMKRFLKNFDHQEKGLYLDSKM
ncbi:polysaccharide biosynthesis protein [Millionella massiliensis]|uniref:polysaccharide biosynthesis protein n=1 Tax=Millionella massiliensis TaxID=1871023 RepID=UPI0024B6BFDA|nr:polysaccharide biosynthesis protein [Millionella massiliensis]